MIQFQFIMNSLKHIRNQTTLIGVAKWIKRDVSTFLMWNNANLFLLRKDIQGYYQGEGGYLESYVIDK